MIRKRKLTHELKNNAKITNKKPLPPSFKQFFLLKNEPHEFSINDLASKPHGLYRWDGIRNHEAKNNLLSMKVGDEAFFYHSSCKNIGIVGTMEIVREAYADPHAMDPSSKYYDAKSTITDPRWYNIDVKLTNQWSDVLPLSDLKAHSSSNQPLEKLALFRRHRLSVNKVSPEEWAFINELATSKGLQV